jgi:MoaA/NifB/PqqE/SkfB family radical SAM enzyme
MLKENWYFIRKVTTCKRIVNTLKAFSGYGLSLVTRKVFVWGYPPIVFIEPTNICNLKCPMCPSGNGTLKRAKGYMDFALFKKVIDEIKDYSVMLVLWNQGEPFLHPEFLKMAEYANARKLYTLVSTNANQMPDAEEIIKSGIDSIIVSLDGATQETYNQYRVNGNLQKVLDNVKKMTIAKKKLNMKIPLIRWQFLVMKHNEHEIELIQNMAKALQVDNIALKSLQIYTKDDIAFLPSNPKYRRYKISGEHFELQFALKNRCYRIWTKPVVNWNGEMAICCFDKDIQYPVGNVKDNTLLSIWRGNAFNKMRAQILKKRKQIPICTNCGEGVKLKIKEKKV